jgi:hypothetical protein
MKNNVINSSKFHNLAGLATVVSILACYGMLAFVGLSSLLGLSLNIHEGAWACVITLFAWLAAVGVAISFRRYRALGPLLLVVAGAFLITWVMFVSFNRILEIAGFAGLITASLWERKLKKCAPQQLSLKTASKFSDTVDN